MKRSSVFLIAQRDYFAYIGAWGFWLSLITAPVIIAALIFAPVLLARAEPPRVLAILAENGDDAATVTRAFEVQALRDARGEIRAYLAAASPSIAEEAIAAFDAETSRAGAIAAAREVVERRAQGALGAFPRPQPRYIITPAPATEMQGVRPFLSGLQTLPDGRSLYGALYIRRAQGTPVIEYWSVNFSQSEPSNIAYGAMRLAMQREALAAQGLASSEADRLAGFDPQVVQFDPRPGVGGGQEVTVRQRAPAIAAIALAFVLWSIVFSVANMLLNGVIEEKSNKILDTLLTSVTPIELLIGKLIGVAMVSLTLFLFWGALGGGLLSMAATRMAESQIGQFAAAFLEPHLLAAFAIGFIAGYLMYGAIFLALGSLCESIQEAQTLLGPVALVLAVPMMMLMPALDNPNAPIIETASWIPLFTPFLLLMRAPAGLSWLEIAGMGAVMAVTVVLVLWLAARVFKAGVVDQVSMAGWRGRKDAKG
jgi:ABC-2 type transport system permease protein